MGALDNILEYGNALAEAQYIIELRARHENAASNERRLQELANELLPESLRQFYKPSEGSLWRYISTTRLEGSNGLETAAMTLALAYFPEEEVLMAAANCGSKRLALIAGCIIHYENQARPPHDPITQIIKNGDAALSTRVSGVPYLLQ